MAISERLRAFLEDQQAVYELVTHAHTGSSHESATESHIPEDHLAKAVLLKDGEGYVLAVIPASQWVKTHALRDELGRELHLADESEVERLFNDCDLGAVPPVGQAYGLETLMDESLTTLATVYFEVGDHEHLARVDGETFRRLTQGARRGHYSQP